MYQNTAQGIASLGRNNDSMLVHMTPGEVGGLQQLAQVHGGSLSINPKTGLVEAGFLSSILPMLAGAAVVGLSGGAAAPWMGALAGGATGAMFGDPKRGMLMNAGMGALGGYGGGSMYSGLSAAGMGAAAFSPEQLAGFDTAGQSALQNEVAQRAFIEQGYNDLIPAPMEGGALDSQPFYPQYSDAAPQYAYTPQQIANEAQYAAQSNTAVPSGKFSLSNIDPLKFAKANMGPLAAVGLPALMGAGFFKPNTLNMAGNQPKPAQFYNTTFKPTELDQVTGKYKAAYYGPGSYGPTATLAAGGLMDGAMVNPMQNPTPSYPTARIDQGMDAGGVTSFAGGGPATGSVYQAANAMFPDDSAKTPDVSGLSNAQIALLADEADDPFTQAAAVTERDRREITQRSPKSTYTKHAAHGGLMNLSNEYAAGGRLLQGPGDGMSDSIPAVIKGPKPQRAALAQGEFVIPADVVSHLGNGSTDAGAKRLYSMMDKIRHARTGNKKQGRQINPDKFMPA